jgi:hypothetical protein
MKYQNLRSASFAAFTLFTASMAYAQEPCGDESCPEGYTCELTTYESCADACRPSPPGEPSECTPVPCETVSYESCQRAACETDADCGDQMACHTLVRPTAPTTPTACPPGAACDPIAAPPEVEPEEYKQCTPRSELPCEENSDCGDGFECVPAVSCACPGTTAPSAAPVPTSGAEADVAPDPMPPSGLPLPPSEVDGGAAPPNPPDDCSCGPTGTNYCQMKDIECDSDSDCPTDWACIQSPGSCWADSEGNSGCESGRAQCYPSSPTPSEPPVPTDPGGTPTNGDDDMPSEPSPETPQGPGTTPPRGEHAGGHGRPFGLWGCSVDNVVGTTTSAPWALLSLVFGASFIRRRHTKRRG